jgi:hypothetical protein
MEHLSSDVEQHEHREIEQKVQSIRDKVQEFCSKGYNEKEEKEYISFK